MMIRLEEFSDFQIFDKSDYKNYQEHVQVITKTIYKLPCFDNFYSGIILEVREHLTWCSKVFHIIYKFEESCYTLRSIKYSAFGEKLYDENSTFNDPVELMDLNVINYGDLVIGTWVTA